VADPHFETPRLAELYDPLDLDRSDREAYRRLVDELGAMRVLDIGCGTGTFACMLASRGKDVIGLDPAGALLDVARKKRGADVATMTGNVAQIFVTDDERSTTLRACHQALRRSPSLHQRSQSRPVPEPANAPAMARHGGLLARSNAVNRENAHR
jgi:SAM-dependent methyltransferase